MSNERRKLYISLIPFLLCCNVHSQSFVIADSTKSRTIVYDICFTPGGSALAAALESSLILYDSVTGDELIKFPDGHKKDINTLDISSDSSIIVTGSKDSTVIIWSVKTGAILKRLNFNIGVITSVKFTNNNDYFYTSGTEGRLILYSIFSDAVIFDKKIHHGLITAIDISHNENIIATSGSEGSVLLLDAYTGEKVSELYKNAGWIRDIAFSLDGSRIIAGGDKGIIYSWKKSTAGEFMLISKDKKTSNWIYGVDIQKENNCYAYCGMNKRFYANIKTFDYVNKCGVNVFKVKIKPGNSIYTIIAAATNGRGIIIKNVSEMKASK